MRRGYLRYLAVVVLAASLVPSACSPDPDSDTGGTDVVDVSDSTGDASDTADTAGEVAENLVHEFPRYSMEPGEETIPCVQWTLDNDEPLYVNKVALANGGGYHHSNWFVVPEDYASGEDGYFNCKKRGFSEVGAAIRGTVLFAQSTQAKSEVQQFAPGAVVKIPPNHKVVADVHMLNVTTRKLETFSRLTLGLVHPRDVDVVLTPLRLTYKDLSIPPNTESRFTSECNLRENYPGEELDMKLYYLLPHYHELGNFFRVEVFGGPRDGEGLLELSGFNAEANGKTFTDPVDLSGAKGLRFSCGYDNPRDETVGWGLGGQEMCVMLGFVDSEVILDSTVESETKVDRRDGGTVFKSGPCSISRYPKPETQAPPTESEKDGDLYVPEQSDDDLEPIPDCEPIDREAEPFREPTLSNVHTDIFSVTCAFSSCHGADAPAAGLNLKTRKGLRNRLRNHELRTPTDMPLVNPGKPERSWLYRVTSRCDPSSRQGPVAHMPRNSPTLMDADMVAMIREWIERGAAAD